MDCKEFQEYVSAAVDKYLHKEQMASLLDHAGKCPSCRSDYELELITKSLVQSRVQRVPAPAHLADRITRQLHGSSPGMTSLFSRLAGMPFLKPALAFGLAAVAILLLLNRGQHPAEVRPPDDVISQSVANYHAIVAGDIKPQLASRVPEELRSFFVGKTDFPVIVPAMKDCILVGGVVNEYGGDKFAHVVYSRDNNVVYMCQACWERVQNGGKLNLPDEVKAELLRTGWYSRTLPDGGSVVLWTKGKTLCSAVARMSKEDLIACLTAAEISDEW